MHKKLLRQIRKRLDYAKVHNHRKYKNVEVELARIARKLKR